MTEMKTQLDDACDDLIANHSYYFFKAIEKFVKTEFYEDLAEFLLHCEERYEQRNILKIDQKQMVSHLLLLKRIRTRKYVWDSIEDLNDEEEKELTNKNRFAVSDSDNAKLISTCNRYLSKHRKIIVNQGQRIGNTVLNLAQMFDLQLEQQRILQFLLDCELSLKTGVYENEFMSLFSWSDTRSLFKSNLYEILATYVGLKNKRINIDSILDHKKMDASSSKNRKGSNALSIRSAKSPFVDRIYSSESTINPYWPQIPKIYIQLILDDKPVNFVNVMNSFEDQFKPKLTYNDFREQPRVAVIEKLINKSLEDRSIGINLLLYGLPGTGKTEIIHALAKQNNWRLIAIGEDDHITPLERLQNLRFAQSFFGNFNHEKIVFLFDEMEDLLKVKPEDMGKNQINRLLENTPFPMVWTSNDVDSFEQSLLRRMTYASQFEVPVKKVRSQIWHKYVSEKGISVSAENINNYATHYPTVPSIISNVCEVSSKALLNQVETAHMIEDLLTAYNGGVKQKFSKDSYNTQPNEYDFDLVNCNQDLEKFANNLVSKDVISFSMLLYGAPGTGKSAYARHVAKILGKPVICKKPSDLVDKYVGETEKNIEQAFEEARDDNAVLIFDEIDSLLQNRSNAQRSWEVSQVNQLLGEMENSKVPFIATSNLIDHIDPAAMRRFIFKAKFDYLSQVQMQKAFEFFFGIEASVPYTWRLSPGDFVAAKKQIDVLGLTSAQDIINIMKEEFELKNLEGSKPIGFTR